MKHTFSERSRVLKVEDTSDPQRGQVKLRIRLEGKWLAQADLQANQQVRIVNPEPGLLTIQSI